VGLRRLIMSDWFATKTAAPAANGGLDLVMPGPDGPWGDALVAAVRAGEVDERTDRRPPGPAAAAGGSGRRAGHATGLPRRPPGPGQPDPPRAADPAGRRGHHRADQPRRCTPGGPRAPRWR
jgi:hypothetical protein